MGNLAGKWGMLKFKLIGRKRKVQIEQDRHGRGPRGEKPGGAEKSYID